MLLNFTGCTIGVHDCSLKETGSSELIVIDAEEDPDIQSLAQEIARYLQGREQIADTLDGIVHWWILRQRLHEERRKVERAMAYLYQQGMISMRRLPDGRTLYVGCSLSPDNQHPDT